MTGHCGDLLSGKFSPDGNFYLSGGLDKNLFLWDLNNACRNIGVLRGHTNAILDLKWNSTSSKAVTGSADKSVCIWDI